ncbi:MAG: hypothetical protein ABI346_09925 [Candidatus Baltobacteraceae bacterium]
MREPRSDLVSSPPSPVAGLRVLGDLLVRPRRAFATIGLERRWFAAYLLTVGLELAALYLFEPALAHVSLAQTRPGGTSAGLPATQAVRDLVLVNVLATVLGPLVIWGLVAGLLAATTLGQRDRLGYAAFFALCMNCAFVGSLGDFVGAAFIHVRDPASFASFGKILLAAPITLASLRPHGSERELVFLGYWDPTKLWSALLLGYGIASLAKMRLVPALLIAFGIALAMALVTVGN